MYKMSSFINNENVFELIGGREMVTAERANELLEGCSWSENVTIVRLSNKSLGQDAAKIVAEKLRW